MQLADETNEQYIERLAMMETMMRLPVGTREPGNVMIAYNDYAKFADQLAAYQPCRFSVEANAHADASVRWFVTADLTEAEYLERIWRPWRQAQRGQ